MALNTEFERAGPRPNRPHVGPGSRLAIGFVVSPLVIPVALFVVFASASLTGVRKFAAGGFSELVQRTAAFSAIVVSIGYGVTFFLALPIITWLLNRGKATQKRVLMVGVCLGGLPFLGYFAYVAAWELWRAAGFPADTPVLGVWDTISRLVRNGPEALVWLAAGVACGAATAATLLLIAPDSIDAA
jgi:hypothetical protein